MAISSGLALKGAGGLAAATAVGTGTYWLITNSDEVKRNEITRYDKGLIDYLENGGKIQFAVVDESGAALAATFPTFTKTPETLKAIIKVKTNASTESTEGKLEDSEKAKKENLKKLNGDGNGADWTWTCEVKFNKKSTDSNANDLADDYKNKLVKDESENKGFFNKLKEKEGNKDLKIKFIRDCGENRSKEKNKKINGANNLSETINDVVNPANTIKSAKEFDLRVGDTKNTGELTTKLYPVNKEKFEDWFSIKEQK